MCVQRMRFSSIKYRKQHRGKMSTHVSALLNFTLRMRTWCESVLKVVKDSKCTQNRITYMSAFSVKLTGK